MTTTPASGTATSLFPAAPPNAVAPDSSAALRRARMQRFRAEHGWVYWLLGIVFVAGLASLAVILPLGIGLAVLAVVAWIVIYAVQASKARSEFFSAYAAARGLSHTDGGFIAAPLPLLGKGDKRKFEHVMGGPIFDTSCELGLYTYTEVTTDSDGNRQETDYPFTVMSIPLPQQVAQRFAGVYCRDKGLINLKMFDGITHDRAVETESAAFGKEYVLRVVDQQDDIALFELFSTTFLDALASDPAFVVDRQRVQWEQVGGNLLVYIKKHQAETADLDALVAAAGRIYRRYCEEYQ